MACETREEPGQSQKVELVAHSVVSFEDFINCHGVNTGLDSVWVGVFIVEWANVATGRLRTSYIH